jgi:glycerol-3-phosphate acyltransferase PlsX
MSFVGDMKEKKAIKIAIDVMGGDFAPVVPVQAAALASQQMDAHFLLIGDEEKIQPVLKSTKYNSDKIEIHHTYEYIGDDEFPRNIIRQKKDASMNIATSMCGKKEVDAIVSAGNTGAYMLSAIKNIPRIKKINKVAMVSTFPTKRFLTGNKKHYSLILDIGANNNSNAEDLLQFAIMGKHYFSLLTGEKNPKIYLLNIGDEAHKGGKVLVNAYQQLSENDALNFRGNIEGNKIFDGEADVVVCDGFAGNVVLKTTEGMVESMMELGKFAADKNILWKTGLFLLSGGIKKIEPLLDYSEYGGAPILGFQEVVIKAHGRSNMKAFYNAIHIAFESFKHNLSEKISQELE